MMLTSPQRDWIPLLLLNPLTFGQIRCLIHQDNSHHFSGPWYEHSALEIRTGTLLSPKLIFFFFSKYFWPEPLLCIHIFHRHFSRSTKNASPF